MEYKLFKFITAIFLFVVSISITVDAAGVKEYGALSVSGTQLVSRESGDKVVLRGISTHGINWDVGYPYISEAAFKTLRDDYGVNAMRLAMYTTEYYGYCDKGSATDSQDDVKKTLKSRIDDGVKAATNLDMYVIIDWHILNDQDPNKYKSQAKDFFDEISKKYSGHSNVLYEICNEPNGSTSWDDISAYANEIIPVIRANAPDAVIIVGTPTWSQDVDVAADKPLNFDNIMYTLHFYSGTHKDANRNKLTAALDKGLPVMVTEFGVSEASGDGSLDKTEAKKWLDYLDGNGISYFAWSLSNKSESSALLKSGIKKTSGWKISDLSEAGKWVFGQYRTRNGLPNNVVIPGKVTNLKLKNLKGRKLKVTFKKISEADGYQIWYSTSKKFSKASKKTVKNNSVTLKKLKKGKRYYVKVKAYTENLNGKGYGKFSAIKKVKIKK